MASTQSQAVLITLDFPPQVGGVAQYYAALVQADKQPIAVMTADQLPKRWWQMIPYLYRQIRQHGYRTILVGQVLPLGTVTWVVSKLLSIRYVVFIHGMDLLVPQQYPRKRWLLHRILRAADHVITVSEFTKGELLRFEPRVRACTVIHPSAGITPMTTPKLVVGVPAEFILSVGRLVERKGFDQVIKSLEQFPDLHYVVAGNGDDKTRLQQLAKDHGVSTRVHFYHNLSDHEIAYLYQHCLFLAMPSRQLADGDVEGFGIVVLEANRFGKTALGGKAGGMADAIQDGQTGILVDGAVLSDVTTGITKLLDVDYRASLEQNAKRYSEGQTWDYAAQQLVAIINHND